MALNASDGADSSRGLHLDACSGSGRSISSSYDFDYDELEWQSPGRSLKPIRTKPGPNQVWRQGIDGPRFHTVIHMPLADVSPSKNVAGQARKRTSCFRGAEAVLGLSAAALLVGLAALLIWNHSASACWLSATGARASRFLSSGEAGGLNELYERCVASSDATALRSASSPGLVLLRTS